jgi:ubiquitin carboxyl-terminal hydrolase 5/13
VPGFGDRVRKTECVLSFDTPESDAGLFVSLSNFQGYGADYLALAQQRSGDELYLNIKWKKIPKPADPEKKADEAPTKLAIGVEGGFNVRAPPSELWPLMGSHPCSQQHANLPESGAPL